MAYIKFDYKKVLQFWRVIISAVIIQIIGKYAITYFGYSSFSFNTLMSAGLIALPIGVCIGFIWHFSDENRRKSATGLEYTVLLSIFLLTVLVPVFSVSDTLKKYEVINSIKNIDPATVKSLVIINRENNEIKLYFEEMNVIYEFAEACRDIKEYIPSHPEISSAWLVTIESPLQYGLDCAFESSSQVRLIGTIIKKSKSGWQYGQGTFVSYNLRSWFDKYVVKK